MKIEMTDESKKALDRVFEQLNNMDQKEFMELYEKAKNAPLTKMIEAIFTDGTEGESK